MRTATNNPAITAPTGTATTKFKLVAINSDGEADLCGATDQPVGTSMDDTDAGEPQGIRLFSAGTTPMVAAAAITRLAPVYTAASGKITSTPVEGCKLVGIALEAAGADGDEIEVLPAIQPALVVQALAALTYAAPNAGAANSGDATTDTVITSIRTQLIALAADVAALRTSLIDSKAHVSA